MKAINTMCILILIAAALLTACSTDPIASANAAFEAAYTTAIADLMPAALGGRPLRVVATTNIAVDVVAHIGGSAVELTALLPIGADPHGYTPAPRDLQAVADADVIFVSGFNLEEGLGDTLESVAGDVPIVSLSEGIQPLVFSSETLPEEGDGDTHPTESSEDADHDHEGIDPHVWLDPTNVVQWAENAARALSTLDPERASTFNASASEYIARLEALDTWIFAKLALLPEDARSLVTDHRAFGYFADRYGLEIVGAVIPAYSSTASPSPQDLAALLAAIQAYDVPAVFVGVSVNPTLAERIAEDSGIILVPLYTGTLSRADGPAATYIEMMEFDVNAIVNALAGGME